MNERKTEGGRVFSRPGETLESFSYFLRVRLLMFYKGTGAYALTFQDTPEGRVYVVSL